MSPSLYLFSLSQRVAALVSQIQITVRRAGLTNLHKLNFDLPLVLLSFVQASNSTKWTFKIVILRQAFAQVELLRLYLQASICTKFTFKIVFFSRQAFEQVAADERAEMRRARY